MGEVFSNPTSHRDPMEVMFCLLSYHLMERVVDGKFEVK